MEPDPKIRAHYLHAFQQWFSRIVLAYSPGVADTFKPDGSLNHHSGLQFVTVAGPQHRGRVLSISFPNTLAIEPKGHALFKNACYCGANSAGTGLIRSPCQARNTLALPQAPRPNISAHGPVGNARRQASDRPRHGGHLSANVPGEEEDTPTDLDNAAMKLFEQEEIQPETIPQGHWTLGWSAAAIHRHKDWLLSVKGYSRYAYSRESGKPGYGAHYLTPHLGFGTIELLTETNYRERAQYATDIRMPRVSIGPNFREPRMSSCRLTKSTGNSARRTARTRHSSAAWMRRTARACSSSPTRPQGNRTRFFPCRKSWFFFGDTVVCLGSGIQNAVADDETGTTLFQDAWTRSKDNFPFETRNWPRRNASSTASSRILYLSRPTTLHPPDRTTRRLTQ